MEVADKESFYPAAQDLVQCGIKATTTNPTSWKLRISPDTISINKPWFSYSGEALRFDQFEGGVGLENSNFLLRESWYMVKNIGLVMIKVKHFNKYAGWEGALPCKDDSDCLADTIKNPHFEIILDSYFHNPSFKAFVSADGQTYSESIETTNGQGYSVKMVDPNDNSKIIPYTGYLEVMDRNGKVFKWHWADKGVVTISPTILRGLPAGNYPAKFRIWVPNEQFPNEERASDTPLPWSNTTEVILK